MARITLITGEPKSGKSTYLNNKYTELNAAHKVGGIISSDVRNGDGDRTGFVMKNIATNEIVALADLVDGSGKVKLGKWFVRVDNITNFMIPVVKNALHTCDVIFIDEVANMQLLSDDFEKFVMSDALVESYKIIFITIAKAIYDDKTSVVGEYMRRIADDIVLLR